MSDLVGNPKNRFSHDAAHLLLVKSHPVEMKRCEFRDDKKRFVEALVSPVYV